MWSFRFFRFFDHWCSRQKLRLFAMDAVALFGGFWLGSTLVHRQLVEEGTTAAASWPMALLFALCLQTWLYLADLYDVDSTHFPARQATRLLRTLGLGLTCFALLACVVVTFADDGGSSRPLLLSALPLAVGAVLGLVLVWAERASVRLWLGRAARILVVGDQRQAELFSRLIQGHFQFEHVATFDWKALPADLARQQASAGRGGLAIDLAPALMPSTRIEDTLRSYCEAHSQKGRGEGRSRGALQNVQAQAKAQAVGPFDIVVLSASEASRGPSARTLLELKVSGIPVFEAASFIERTQRRLPVELLRADELVFTRGFGQGWLDRLLRRTLDVVASLGLLVVALPILALAALAIRLDSEGPIFYRQERMGEGGRSFFLTKLRTMRVDAECEGKPQWARVNDSRVTRVGRLLRKCRIDELPQIFSVLRGEMSFVGPRPERPYFVEQLDKQIPFYRLRLLSKPGITGWAQVRYPYGASVEDSRAKLEYDLYYLKNRSLFLDLTILFHTVRHVLMGKGAR
jgi:exopolysaccharide biosynthesis polyprenyl glycosylphosphotransferase